MSTKTTFKRISLVAVAAMSMGVLTSVAPANAAVAEGNLTMIQSGSTLAVSAAVNAGPETAQARAGVQTIAITEAIALIATDDYDLYVSTAATAADITDANTAVLNTPTTANVTTGEKSSATLSAAAYNGIATAAKAVKVVTAGGITALAVGTVTFKTASLSAGTWRVYADISPTDAATVAGTIPVGVITVVDAGAPVTAAYSQVGYVAVGTPAAITAKLSLKDSSARSTILVGDETVTHAYTKQTPVSDATMDAITATGVATRTLTGTTFAAYDVVIPANGTAPTVGSKYTITSTIVKGATAYGSASVTYRNVANTSGLTGSIAFVDSTLYGVVSSVSLAASNATASGAYVVVVTDSTGAAVVGVTPIATASVGTITTAIGATDADGENAAIVYTAGTTGGTVTISLSTGTSSLSTSFTAVVTAFGATAAVATTAVKSVVANDGAGVVMTSTAPAMNAWSAAANVSSISVTIGGLDANKTVRMQLTSTATGGKLDGVAAGTSTFPVANAAGEVTFKLGVTSAAAGNALTVNAAHDGANNIEVLVITYTATAATLTTSPLASSLNMSKPSETKTITAAIADQYKNAITGGSFKLTNTTVPVGATAATAVTVNASATGTASFTVVLGATLGTYVFTVAAVNANAGALGSTSTITYSVTATGIAGTLTLTDNDTTALTLTTDDKGSRAVVVNATALSIGTADTTNAAVITVTSATPAALAFTATATNGIRLFTSAPSGVLAVGKSEVTGTAGSSANLWAVPTKVGAGTITVVSGGLTKVYTLTGTAEAAGTIKSALVTLTAGTTAGQYTVAATDVFGNGVAAADIAVSLAGAGSFGNGFKNLTVTTGADGTNTFNVVSSGETGTVIAAALSTTYVAVVAADMKTLGIVGPGTLGATTGKTTATMAAGASNSIVDAATVAAEAAEAAAQDATDAALDATEAAQEAGALAQEAVDLVTALSAEVTKLIAGVRASITYLTKLVMRLAAK